MWVYYFEFLCLNQIKKIYIQLIFRFIKKKAEFPSLLFIKKENINTISIFFFVLKHFHSFELARRKFMQYLLLLVFDFNCGKNTFLIFNLFFAIR